MQRTAYDKSATVGRYIWQNNTSSRGYILKTFDYAVISKQHTVPFMHGA